MRFNPIALGALVIGALIGLFGPAWLAAGVVVVSVIGAVVLRIRTVEAGTGLPGTRPAGRGLPGKGEAETGDAPSAMSPIVLASLGLSTGLAALVSGLGFALGVAAAIAVIIGFLLIGGDRG